MMSNYRPQLLSVGELYMFSDSAIKHLQIPSKDTHVLITPHSITAAPADFEVPTRLNATPHPRSARYLFYDDVSASVGAGVAAGVARGRVFACWTELNTETDVYRVGSLLELVRVVATDLCLKQGKRVRIVVQGSMGSGVFQGLPLQLSGVRRLLDMMDWVDAAGGENLLGEWVKTGALDVDELAEGDDADVVIIIAPQNIVGHSIMPKLEAFVERCEAGNKQVVLLNDKLDDIPSSEGVMGVRGRQERRDYAATFKDLYHFRLVFKKPYFYPIYGAVRKAFGHPWQIYKRRKITQKTEEYVVCKTLEKQPNRDQLTDAIWRGK